MSLCLRSDYEIYDRWWTLDRISWNVYLPAKTEGIVAGKTSAITKRKHSCRVSINSDGEWNTYGVSGRQAQDDHGRTLVIVHQRPEVAGRVFDRPFRDDVLSGFGVALRQRVHNNNDYRQPRSRFRLSRAGILPRAVRIGGTRRPLGRNV